VLAPGTAGQLLQTGGPSANPSWVNSSNSVTSAALDALFGATQGSIIYRNATSWVALPPTTAGYVLSTNGGGANPAWIPNPSSTGAAGTIGTYTVLRDGLARSTIGLNVTATGSGSIYFTDGYPLVGTDVPAGQVWRIMGNLLSPSFTVDSSSYWLGLRVA
jgi:hypothetical protein